MSQELPIYEHRGVLGETLPKNWILEKGLPNVPSLGCPKSYELGTLVSRARTDSFRIGCVILAGFWAGKFTNGQARSSVAACCPISG